MSLDKEKQKKTANEKALKNRESLQNDKIATALRANLKKRKAQINARKNS